VNGLETPAPTDRKPPERTTSATAERTSRTQLLIIFLARTVINTAFRLTYPFLPSIARGLNISLTTASGIVAFRMAGRMVAPVLGPISDRYGRRRVMEIALLIFALASLLLASVGTLAAAAIAFALYGVAKALYDVAVYAYLGDTVAYRERGRAIGIVELSWSNAWLLGVPASGFLIERFGWRAPWAVLIGLGLLAAWSTRICLPPASRPATHERSALSVASIVATWHNLLRRRSVIPFLLTTLFLMLAIEIPFIVYGAWLETTYDLSLSTLGLASIVVGLAEATAEFGTTVVTDRLGKRRSVLIGLLGLAASLAVLPWLSRLGLVGALTGVVLMMLTFEFGMVSLLPLATELAPDARGSLISLYVTISSLSRILGTVAGGWLWQWENIALHAGVGAICALIAALSLTRIRAVAQLVPSAQSQT
jgi:predicted MFS family arabinose efflux permease